MPTLRSASRRISRRRLPLGGVIPAARPLVARTVTAVIMAAIGGLLLAVPTAAQGSGPSGVSVLAAVAVPAPAYPVSHRGDALHVVYADEPMVIQVTLVNGGATALAGPAPTGWLDALTIELHDAARAAGGVTISFDVLSVLDRSGADGAAEVTTVAAGALHEARLRLHAAQVPGPGTYRLRAILDGVRLGAGWPASVLAAEQTLEIHAVETDFDRWNVLHARGVQARLEGRYTDARHWLEQLLAGHSESLPGWYELGLTQLADGRCAEATAAFQQAQTLAAAPADAATGASRFGRAPAIAQAIQRHLAACAG